MTPVSTRAVSIVIPYYQGKQILAKTLAAIARQDFPHESVEVIIAHDGSSDNIGEMSRQSLGDIGLHQVWISRRGYRLSTARNVGIRCARGVTIVLLDFDIVVRDNFVSAHMIHQRSTQHRITFGLRKFVDLANVGAEVIRSGAVRFDELQDVPSISNGLRSVDKRFYELSLLPHHQFPCNLCHGCNLAFPRQLAISVGLFDEAFNGNTNYEDIEFAYRLWAAGAEIVFVPEATVYHQENDIVDYETRRRGMSVNLSKLYDRVPGLQAFRERLKEQSRWQTR